MHPSASLRLCVSASLHFVALRSVCLSIKLSLLCVSVCDSDLRCLCVCTGMCRLCVWMCSKRGIAEPVDGFKPLVNQDQRMHIDVWNHTLTVPSPWDVPEAVTAILYLSDVADCEGGTAVVPRTPGGDESYPYPNFAMPGVGGIPWINDRKCAEAFLEQHYPEVHAFRRQLYTRERTVAYRVGTVLLYRYDTWHRGRPITPGALRVVMNLAWKRRSCGLRITSWQAGWAKSMYEWPVPGQLLNCAGQFETLVCGLTDEQRGALGFPLLDDAYWRDLRNVRLTRLRYGPAFQSQLPTLEQLDAMEEGASPSRTPADVATDTALRRRLLAVAVCLGVVAVARRWL